MDKTFDLNNKLILPLSVIFGLIYLNISILYYFYC